MYTKRYIIDDYRRTQLDISRVHCLDNHIGIYHYKCKKINWSFNHSTDNDECQYCKTSPSGLFHSTPNIFDVIVNTTCKLFRLKKMIIAPDDCPQCHPYLTEVSIVDNSEKEYERTLKKKKTYKKLSLQEKERKAQAWLQKI